MAKQRLAGSKPIISRYVIRALATMVLWVRRKISLPENPPTETVQQTESERAMASGAFSRDSKGRTHVRSVDRHPKNNYVTPVYVYGYPEKEPGRGIRKR